MSEDKVERARIVQNREQASLAGMWSTNSDTLERRLETVVGSHCGALLSRLASFGLVGIGVPLRNLNKGEIYVARVRVF